MEEERFDSSATDYESALKLLTKKLEVGMIDSSAHSSPCCVVMSLKPFA